MRESVEGLKFIKVIPGVGYYQDNDTDDMYIARCIECRMFLTADEHHYGHDCEA